MKFYKVILSHHKQDIVLDDADYQKLLTALDTGSFVRLKKAIINPSFIVAIIPIPQKDALDTENPPRKVEGYVDEERGVFVVTKDEHPVSATIADAFQKA